MAPDEFNRITDMLGHSHPTRRVFSAVVEEAVDHFFLNPGHSYKCGEPAVIACFRSICERLHFKGCASEHIGATYTALFELYQARIAEW
jgi:hypothetical protein